jgi:hypothetical protein
MTNRPIAWLFLAAFAAGHALATTPKVQNPDKLHTDQTAYFETIGEDRRSVYAVAEVGRATVRTCDEFLAELPNGFPQRISVLLDRSTYETDNDKAYRLSITDGGFVTLRIFWNKDLSLETLCHAMMEAFLLRYVHYKYGRAATSGMRAWVIAGLGQKCFIRYRSAEAEYLAAKQWNLSPEIVARTLEIKAGDPCNRTLAYALLETYLASNLRREDRQQLLEFALVGGSVEVALSKGKDEDSVDLNGQAWWERGMHSFARNHQGAVDSMETSRLWLKSLADIDAFAADPDSASSAPNLREIAAYANNAEILNVIEVRQKLLLSGMLRVNPLYYNAARSLGRYYEQILYGEPGFRRTATLIDYLNDLNAAQNLQAIAEKALDETKEVNR